MQAFNEVQKLLSKTNGKLVGDLMTPAPVVIRETTNLEDAARFCCPSTFSIFKFVVFLNFDVSCNKKMEQQTEEE